MQSSKQKIKHTDSLITISSSSEEEKGASSSPILYLRVCCGQIVFIFCLQHVLWQFLCFIILKNCVLQIRRCFFSLLNNFIEKQNFNILSSIFKGFWRINPLFKLSTLHKEKNNLIPVTVKLLTVCNSLFLTFSLWGLLYPFCHPLLSDHWAEQCTSSW